MMTAAQAEEGGEALPQAIDTLLRFKKDQPGCLATRAADADSRPAALAENIAPDFAAAEKAYWELASHEGIPPRSKRDPSPDDRFVASNRSTGRGPGQLSPVCRPAIRAVRVYEIGSSATPEKSADAIRQLQEIIDTTNDQGAAQGRAYNMIGDCYRRDPKTKKDARLYAYLWVDVVYNDDATEVTKAVSRLAGFFAELKDDDSARKYRRERLKGR